MLKKQLSEKQMPFLFLRIWDIRESEVNLFHVILSVTLEKTTCRGISIAIKPIIRIAFLNRRAIKCLKSVLKD